MGTRNGVRIGYGKRILTPADVAGLAAWYDVSSSSLLASNGSAVSDGGSVALIADKSGNSGVNCLCLNGVVGNYASRADAAAVSITGDLDLRANVALNDWTPTTDQPLIAKWNSSGNQRSYLLYVLATTGRLILTWSIDGTSGSAPFASSTVSPTVSDMSSLWVRATLDVDNGAGGYVVTFYTSPDGVIWSQLGSTVTGASTTSIFDSTAMVEMGTLSSGVSTPASGRWYRAQIYNGIDGTLVFDANFATASKLATSFTESSSNAATVTINSSGDLGARISGERDLYQATSTKQPIYLGANGVQYGYLNGVSGNYFSSPDSAAVSVTGDIDIRAYVALTDWTPSANQTLVSKYASSAGGNSYSFDVLTSGNLNLTISVDGTAFSAVNSGTPTGVTDRAAKWVRVTRVAATGAVSFFLSDDGVTWSGLGAGGTSTTGSIFDSTTQLVVGAANSGTANFVNGVIYRAQIYNGIGGTLVFDANFDTYVSGTTFTESSSNAATVTLNGGATVAGKTPALYFDGTNDYMKAAAFSLSQPETVYFVGQQVSWTSGDFFFDGYTNLTAALRQITSSPTIVLQSDVNQAPTSGGLAVGTSTVLCLGLNGTSSAIRVNRNSASVGNPGSASANGFVLASSGVGSNYGNIRVNAVLIYSTVQDTTTQNFLIYILGKLFGISV